MQEVWLPPWEKHNVPHPNFTFFLTHFSTSSLPTPNLVSCATNIVSHLYRGSHTFRIDCFASSILYGESTGGPANDGGEGVKPKCWKASPGRREPVRTWRKARWHTELYGVISE